MRSHIWILCTLACWSPLAAARFGRRAAVEVDREPQLAVGGFKRAHLQHNQRAQITASNSTTVSSSSSSSSSTSTSTSKPAVQAAAQAQASSTGPTSTTLTTSTATASPSTTPGPNASICPIANGGSFFLSLTPWTTQCSDVTVEVDDPENYTVNQPYYNYVDTCLKSYCLSTYSEFVSAHNVTRVITQTRPRNSGVFGTGSQSTVIVSELQWTEVATVTVVGAQAYIPDYPCCSQCTLSAGTVQLYFWSDQIPQSTASSPASNSAVLTADPVGSTAVVDGFTFTSPSVYIAFTSLGASDYCGPVGNVLADTTIAFDLSEISTVIPETIVTQCTVTDARITQPIVSTPAPSPINLADVAQDCSTIPGYYYFATAWYNELNAGDPCHPIIALPTRINNLQPAWKDCVADVEGGFYDPPKVLTQQGALLPPSSAAPASTSAPPAQSDSDPSLPTGDPASSSPSSPADPPSGDPGTDPSSTPGDPGNTVAPPPSSSPPAQESSDPPVETPAGVPANTPAGTPASSPASTPANGATTILITPPPQISSSPAVITVGSSTITADQSSRFTIGSQTLKPGSSITVSGTVVSLDPSGSTAVIGSSTVALSPANTGTQITVGGTTVNIPPPGSSTVLSDGQTLSAGGSTVTVGGTPVVVLPGGSSVVIGTSTQAVNPPAGAPSITIGNSVVTENSASQFIVGSSTLAVGGTPITVSGTVFSIGTNTNGQTQLVVSPAPTLPPITIGGATISATNGDTFIISGSTLTPGGTVTITDSTGAITVISLDPSASDIVIGGSTSFFPTPSNNGGVGSYIISALGGPGPTSSPSGAEPFTGAASSAKLDGAMLVWSFVSLGAFMGMLIL